MSYFQGIYSLFQLQQVFLFSVDFELVFLACHA